MIVSQLKVLSDIACDDAVEVVRDALACNATGVILVRNEWCRVRKRDYAMFAQAFPTQLRASGTGLVIGFGRGGAALGPVCAGILFSIDWPLTGSRPFSHAAL